jgi:hypothetical protein
MMDTALSQHFSRTRQVYLLMQDVNGSPFQAQVLNIHDRNCLLVECKSLVSDSAKALKLVLALSNTPQESETWPLQYVGPGTQNPNAPLFWFRVKERFIPMSTPSAPTNSNQRQKFRIDVKREIAVTQPDSIQVPGLLLNLSGGGCQAAFPYTLDLSRPAQLMFQPNPQEPLPTSPVQCKLIKQTELDFELVEDIKFEFEDWRRNAKKRGIKPVWTGYRLQFIGFQTRNDQDLIFKYCFQEQLRQKVSATHEGAGV